MKKFLYGFAIVAACALSGCVMLGDKMDQFRWRFMTLPFYFFDNVAGYQHVPQPPTIEEPVNFSVAISGGGSRSAIFASAVLEQLAYIPDPRHAGRTVLDGVDVVSAVSGGSMSASYYALYKPRDFSNQDETVAFFQKYKSNMSVDFHLRGVGHYLSHPWEAVSKYYTRQRFVQTLGETFDQHLFKGSTFSMLHERELAGDAPVLMVNATSLDTGRKFVFTNLHVQQNFAMDGGAFMRQLPTFMPEKDVPGLSLLGQVASTPIYQPFGFDAINSDIGQFRIAHAVAASCAYPVMPGPATLMNYAHTGYVHLADGGVNDNSGVDSIVGRYVSALQQKQKPMKQVIVSINVAAAIEDQKSGDPDGYVGAISYADRASMTLANRAQVFAQVLYNAPNSVTVININLPEASYSKQLDSGMAMLAISERDMQTLLNAATELVHRHRDKITTALAGR